MSDQIAFVVVPSADKPGIDNYIRENVASTSRRNVHVLTDECAENFTTDQKKHVARSIADEISAFEPNRNHVIFLHGNTKCDDRELKNLWIDQGCDGGKFTKCGSTKLRRDLQTHLKSISVFWREYANAQISNFDGKSTPLDVWLQQFGELGVTPVGRRLAMQLRVIRLGNLNSDPFAPRTEDQLGQRQFHCYVSDGDRGGSWVNIQDALAHGHPPERVGEIVWHKETATLTLPNLDADEIVVCEDGLWTGTETIRRLRALSDSPAGCLLRLKFAVVSDYGLLVTRHAIRSLGMQGQVLIDTAGSELMRFLRDDLSDEVKYGKNSSIEEYFEMLYDFTLPLAFSNSDEWSTTDQDVCKTIGSQLVTQWQKRINGTDPTPEAIKRFELGGRWLRINYSLFQECPESLSACVLARWSSRTGGKKGAMEAPFHRCAKDR